MVFGVSNKAAWLRGVLSPVLVVTRVSPVCGVFPRQCRDAVCNGNKDVGQQAQVILGDDVSSLAANAWGMWDGLSCEDADRSAESR